MQLSGSSILASDSEVNIQWRRMSARTKLPRELLKSVRRYGTVQCSSDCQFVFENCHAVIPILVISDRCSCAIFLRNICARVYIKAMKFLSREQSLHFLSFSTCFALYQYASFNVIITAYNLRQNINSFLASVRD